MHIFKQRVVLIMLAVFIIVMALISTILLIKNKKEELNKSLSDEDISLYINYDLADIEIYDIAAERYKDKSETNATIYKGTSVCIKLNATDAQLTEIMSKITLEDQLISPGDQQFFKKNNIDMSAIKQMGVSWNQYEENKFFSTTYKPYSINWFFFETGYDDKFNIIIKTNLPFWF